VKHCVVMMLIAQVLRCGEYLFFVRQTRPSSSKHRFFLFFSFYLAAAAPYFPHFSLQQNFFVRSIIRSNYSPFLRFFLGRLHIYLFCSHKAGRSTHSLGSLRSSDLPGVTGGR
jgi:hypothetical protein